MTDRDDQPVTVDDTASRRMVVVGYVRRAHGLEGELLVHLQTDYPEETFVPERVFRVTEGGPVGYPADLTLERARPHGGGWILGFREIEGRTLAERYGGAHLAVEPEKLLPPEADEYFLHDLIDLVVVAREDGDPVGRVEGVYDTPGRPILQVCDEDGEEVLIPFDRRIVDEVGLEEEILRISPPEGLLEL